MEVEITDEEGVAVLEAHRNMSGKFFTTKMFFFLGLDFVRRSNVQLFASLLCVASFHLFFTTCLPYIAPFSHTHTHISSLRTGFPYYSTTPRDYPGSPLMFNHSPMVKPCRLDSQYVVYATAELFGVAVSQGMVWLNDWSFDANSWSFILFLLCVGSIVCMRTRVHFDL